MTTKNLFAGRRVLIVEDDYWNAADLVPRFVAAGADIIGPAATLEQGMRHLNEAGDIFGAILDISLRGEMVFPLADALANRKVPFVFLSGYQRQIIPSRFANATLLAKPLDSQSVSKVFAGLNGVEEGRSPIFLNRLLSALPPKDRAMIRPLIRSVDLPQGMILEMPRTPIDGAYFIETGVASMIVVSAGRREIEVGIIGSEGMTGTALVQEDMLSPYRLIMQMDGAGHRIEACDLAAALKVSPALRSLCTRFTRTLSIQVACTALANGRYKLEQRLARWLLMMDDRNDTDRISLTHEYLAVMLGVRRPGVTVALHILEGEHFIKSVRGQIFIRDRRALAEYAKATYGLAEAEYTRIMGFPLQARKLFEASQVGG